MKGSSYSLGASSSLLIFAFKCTNISMNIVSLGSGLGAIEPTSVQSSVGHV